MDNQQGPIRPIHQDVFWMQQALVMAQQAASCLEVPVGAILVDEQGQEISRAHNLKERQKDATAHAELLVIRQAAELRDNWRLNACTLYVTLEPCFMCMNALVQARIQTLVFGAYDLKAGALSLGESFHQDQRLNHRFNVIGGLLQYECGQLLSQFFKERRTSYRSE